MEYCLEFQDAQNGWAVVTDTEDGLIDEVQNAASGWSRDNEVYELNIRLEGVMEEIRTKFVIDETDGEVKQEDVPLTLKEYERRKDLVLQQYEEELQRIGNDWVKNT